VQSNLYKFPSLELAVSVYEFLENMESDKNFPILVNSSELSLKLVQSAQQLVFDAMFVPIRRSLHQLELKEDFSRVTVTENIPKFSLTPQSYVKFIVEHLLVLRQLLEPYDQSDSYYKVRPSSGASAPVEEDDEGTVDSFPSPFCSSFSCIILLIHAFL